MTQQQTDPVQQGLSYMRHQGAKGFADIDAMLERTANDWRACLHGLSEAQASFKPGGEWCAKECLGHAIQTNRGINQDVAGLAGVEPPEEKAVEVRTMGMQAPEYEAMPINDLCDMIVGALEETRMLAVALQKSETLDKSFPHPLFGPLNLKEWLAFHRIHSMDHIQQIDKIKAHPAYPRS
jgi:DinB superfamily